MEAVWPLTSLPLGFTWFGTNGGSTAVFQGVSDKRVLGWTAAGGAPGEAPTLGILGDGDGLRSFESDFTLGRIFDFKVAIYISTTCSGWHALCIVEKLHV